LKKKINQVIKNKTMNKFYSFFLAVAISSTAFGQCVADFDFGDVGFGVSPDPAQGENFVSGVVGQQYSDVLHILIPTFASDVDEAYPPTLPIDSIELISVVLTDTITLMEYSPEELGLMVVCNNNGDSPDPCMFMGGTQYCASIQGIPTIPGIYRLDLNVLGWLTIFEPFSAAFVFSNFSLNIQCDLVESIATLDSDSDLGTLGSIDVTLAEGVVATSFSWTDANGTVVGTEEDLTDLSPGTYTLTLVADGCTSVYEGNEIIDTAAACTLAADYVIEGGGIDVTVTGAEGVATFSWTDMDGITISSSEDLTDVVDGEYALLITDEDGCTVELSGLTVVKVESFNASTTWSVIPNPTSSSFFIQSNFLNDTQIRVLDVSGRVILNESLSSNQMWSVNDWKEGVYFIQLVGNYGTTTRRLVVQH
jgi:hypothetical protein